MMTSAVSQPFPSDCVPNVHSIGGSPLFHVNVFADVDVQSTPENGILPRLIGILRRMMRIFSLNKNKIAIWTV